MSHEREGRRHGRQLTAATKLMNEIRIAPSVSGYSVRLQVRDAQVFKELVGSLKRTVPRFARRFDAVEGCWYVKAEAAADVEGWLGLAVKRYNVSVVWERPEEA